MAEAIIIIPTYNEIENVERMIHAVMSLSDEFHLLFVDDNSPDGTAERIMELQGRYSGRIFLSSVLVNSDWVLHIFTDLNGLFKKGMTLFFEMDCDFSHDPKDLLRLYKSAKDGADVSVGSRYCKGGRVSNWPLKRILMSYFASVYVRMILWIPIKDTTAGFKCYRRKVLENIKLDSVIFKGYAFQICMKYAAIRHGFKVVEVPITFVDREFGTSKMSTSIFKEAFFGVWKMRKMEL